MRQPPKPTLAEFLSEIESGIISTELFEDLLDVLFWIKDTELRLIYVNKAFAKWVNKPVSQIIGKTDSELYFTDLATVFTEDDSVVIQTGQAIHRKIELVANRYGGVEWRLATKIPLLNHQGEVIGTAGISQPSKQDTNAQLPEQYLLFSNMIDYLRDNMAEPLTTTQLGKQFGMSTSTIERRFKEYLGKSPKAFIEELKFNRARELLEETELNVATIGIQVGYPDAASFSRAFARYFGKPPGQFRKQGDSGT